MTDLIKNLKEAGEGRTPGPWDSDGTAVLCQREYDVLVPECCGRPLRTGECCGNAVPGREVGVDVEKIAEASNIDARFIAFMGTHYGEILSALIAGQEAIERVEELEGALAEIGEFAHDNSTGPAIPDAFWSIRDMAYATGETQAERAQRIKREVAGEVMINPAPSNNGEG